ncbi:sigma-G-dependent sporulation-specific acid-soluble spore protein CsgA [Neobacillus niacini]|uniref:sigma-G-dependent sporulation-specific acid-soluble spore protein CsgA n=1 Tax=Neobacillus niacini TaxID=86668 RepID=UPI003B58AABA
MVKKVDKTLGYLREILSNYSDGHNEGKQVYRKLSEGKFNTEGDFVRQLNQKEINFLNEILPNEINYAKEEQDEKRAHELNEVFELLF